MCNEFSVLRAFETKKKKNLPEELNVFYVFSLTPVFGRGKKKNDEI